MNGRLIIWLVLLIETGLLLLGEIGRGMILVIGFFMTPIAIYFLFKDINTRKSGGKE